MKEFDYIIIGGGCAGLSLAYELEIFDKLKDKTLAIIEPREDYKRDKGFSTDVYFTVEVDGEIIIDEVSLKKDKLANLLNATTGRVPDIIVRGKASSEDLEEYDKLVTEVDSLKGVKGSDAKRKRDEEDFTDFDVEVKVQNIINNSSELNYNAANLTTAGYKNVNESAHFYGIEEVETKTLDVYNFPPMIVEDFPRFSYRGMMLDV